MSDPYASNVELLLAFDKSDVTGSNCFFDYSQRKSIIIKNGNATLSTVQKKYGDTSLYLDGSGSYLTSLNNPVFAVGSNDFTVELWTYMTSLPSAYKRWLSYCKPSPAVAADESFLFEMDTTNKLLGAVVIGTTYYTITDPSAITINTWIHWALRAGTVLTMYRNGVSVGTVAIPTGAVTDSSTHQLYIGRFPTVAARDFAGYMDDIRLTKGVARYTTTFTPPAYGVKADCAYQAFQGAVIKKQILQLFNNRSFTSMTFKGILKPRIGNLLIENARRFNPTLGSGTLSGTVSISSEHVRRKVRLYESSTGILIQEIYSGLNGAYSFTGLRTGFKYTITATDYNNIYDDVILSNLTPI